MTSKVGAAGTTTAAPKQQQIAASNSRTPNVPQASGSTTGAVTSSRDVLPTASDALAEHAAAIRQLGKRVVTDVIEIGERLTACRELCGYGHWLPWLDREFRWSEQTALNFMRVAELHKSKTVLDLDLPVRALYLLAAPSTPETARDEIIERAKTRPVSVADVRETIVSAKQRRRIPGDFARDIAKKEAEATSGNSGPMSPEQSAAKPVHGRTHVCSNCSRRGQLDEVQKHSYPAYPGHPAYKDIKVVWLHDACVSAFEEAQREAQRLGFLHHAEEAATLALYDGPVDREVVKAVDRVMKQWGALRDKFQAAAKGSPPNDDGLEIPPTLPRSSS
jgi:hypothetical protein